MFVKTLTAEENYSGSKIESFTKQFQTHISQKQKTFSEFFIEVLKCAWNFERFQKNDEYPSLIISEIIDAEWLGYLNV